MKRNFDLMFNILHHVQSFSQPGPVQFKDFGYEDHIVERHIEMLFDTGYLDGLDARKVSGRVIAISDLTAVGHDFMSALKQGDVRERLAISLSSSERGCLSLSLVRQLADELAGRHLRQKLRLS